MTEGELPIEIAPDEVIVRAIKTPVHYDSRKGRLRPSAFRAQAGRDDVSVMRKRYLGNDGCKNKAVQIAGVAYIGLAALRAEQIEATKAHVVDSRVGQFVGHAHIEQGVFAPASGETAPPELIGRYKALAEAARYYPDDQPNVAGWHGQDIL